MKRTCLPLTLAAALFASCTSVDEYHYGYAPAYRSLPDGFEKVDIRGTTYWHHGGRFYKHDAERGYLLVKPPRGHTAVVSTAGAANPTPNATAAPSAEPSWIKPGGGTIGERGRPRSVGRSPARRRSRSAN